MEHLLDILKEEETRLKTLTELYRQKNNPLYGDKIAELESLDNALKSVVNTPSGHACFVREVLHIPSVFDSFADGLSDYCRGLFKVETRLDDSLINSIMCTMNRENAGRDIMGYNGKYSNLDMVIHYDGFIFDPKKKESWEDIRKFDDDGLIAIYARDPNDFNTSKSVIDFMGCLIGNEVEIPYLKREDSDDYAYTGTTNVEKLASSEYILDINFPDSLKLNEELISEIKDKVSEPGTSPGNLGYVALLHGHKRANAKSFSSMRLLLEDPVVNGLSFTFRGGYLKEAAYSLLKCLGKIEDIAPTFSHYDAAVKGAKMEEKQEVLQA